MPLQHARELGALFVDWLMPHAPKFCADPTDRRPFALELRLAPQLEASSVPLRSADMREPEKVEGLRPPLAARPALFGDKAPEGNQSRLVRVKIECKLRELSTAE
jgi:hypothetical protein